MVIREYGQRNTKTLLFFQSTAENYTDFLDAVNLLAKHFHVMLFSHTVSGMTSLPESL